MVRRTTKKGFTLVEILIVVIILGILAAIVIPQFTNASQDARRSNMISQLQTLKSQVELYKLQHQDKGPAAGQFWTALTSKTDMNGNVTSATGAGVYGPYMQERSVNPLTNSSTVGEVGSTPAIYSAAPAATNGWVYDTANYAVYGVAENGRIADANGYGVAPTN